MKANELMIGDLIRIKGHTCKVSYLAPFDIGDARLAVISNDYDGNPYLDDIEPIPITEAIIEANEFFHNEEWNKGCYAYDAHKLDLAWSIGFHFLNGEKQFHSSGKKGTLSFWRCEYVHELQHALRICGLTELADNFKLE